MVARRGPRYARQLGQLQSRYGIRSPERDVHSQRQGRSLGVRRDDGFCGHHAQPPSGQPAEKDAAPHAQDGERRNARKQGPSPSGLCINAGPAMFRGGQHWHLPDITPELGHIGEQEDHGGTGLR